MWTEWTTFQDFQLFLWSFLDIWNIEWISISRSLEKGRFYYRSIKITLKKKKKRKKITLFICRTVDQQRVVQVKRPNENNSLCRWPAASKSSLAGKCDCLGISQHIMRLIFNVSHSCVDTNCLNHRLSLLSLFIICVYNIGVSLHPTWYNLLPHNLAG